MASDLSDPTMLLGSAPVRTEGERLYAGRYRVERLVGRGGMGAVYRALDVIVGERLMARIEAQPPYRFPILQLRMRVAAWYGDRERPRQILAELHGDPLAGYNRILIGYGRALLGDVDKPEMDAYIRDILATNLSPRLYTVLCQLCAELYCARGDALDALEHLRKAADAVLTDIEWVDRCPLLAPLRALPGFDHIRRKVRVRVDEMWVL